MLNSKGEVFHSIKLEPILLHRRQWIRAPLQTKLWQPQTQAQVNQVRWLFFSVAQMQALG